MHLPFHMEKDVWSCVKDFMSGKLQKRIHQQNNRITSMHHRMMELVIFFFIYPKENPVSVFIVSHELLLGLQCLKILQLQFEWNNYLVFPNSNILYLMKCFNFEGSSWRSRLLECWMEWRKWMERAKIAQNGRAFQLLDFNRSKKYCKLNTYIYILVKQLLIIMNFQGKPIYSYSIITMESNSTLSWLHHRMPAILTSDEEVMVC